MRLCGYVCLSVNTIACICEKYSVPGEDKIKAITLIDLSAVCCICSERNGGKTIRIAA